MDTYHFYQSADEGAAGPKEAASKASGPKVLQVSTPVTFVPGE